MKKINLIAFLLALAPSTLADGGMMGFGSNYGMMSGGFFGMGFLWLIGVILVSFIFSATFWFCYKWIVVGNSLTRNKSKKRK